MTTQNLTVENLPEQEIKKTECKFMSVNHFAEYIDVHPNTVRRLSVHRDYKDCFIRMDISRTKIQGILRVDVDRIISIMNLQHCASVSARISNVTSYNREYYSVIKK